MKKFYEAIVIGASWGGTEALIEIIKDLPPGFSIPIIAVLHRQKDMVSLLPGILSKYSKIPVVEINEKEPVSKEKIFIAPSNYHVLIEEDKTFSLDSSEDVFFSRPSIDVLFESAARIYKDKLIGILLTGANSDGSNGIQTISRTGGLTIVQDPEEAESNIMPKAALAKTKVDYILKKREISQFLLSL